MGFRIYPTPKKDQVKKKMTVEKKFLMEKIQLVFLYKQTNKKCAALVTWEPFASYPWVDKVKANLNRILFCRSYDSLYFTVRTLFPVDSTVFGCWCGCRWSTGQERKQLQSLTMARAGLALTRLLVLFLK